jgi:hypothetical protein
VLISALIPCNVYACNVYAMCTETCPHTQVGSRCKNVCTQTTGNPSVHIRANLVYALEKELLSTARPFCCLHLSCRLHRSPAVQATARAERPVCTGPSIRRTQPAASRAWGGGREWGIERCVVWRERERERETSLK